jgi:hypothetical protein
MSSRGILNYVGYVWVVLGQFGAKIEIKIEIKVY